MTVDTEKGPPPLIVALTGLLFPGLGHLILGKRRRALAFFALLSAMFYFGVFLEREFYHKFDDGGLLSSVNVHPLQARDRTDDLEGTVDRAWKLIFKYAYPFFVGFGNYVVGWKWSEHAERWIARVPGVLKKDEVPVSTRDIGYCFALLSGLLNLLVMMDCFDIACNEEELRRRGKKT
jgi:hypothetical protein